MILFVITACVGFSSSDPTDSTTTDAESTVPTVTDGADTSTTTDSTSTDASSTTDTATPCDLDDVERDPGSNWSDSYSVDGACYCDTTYDHNIGDVLVDTPVGPRTVREICEAIGPGPGRGDNPVYNDVQCGNGPANDAGDEDWCPGRVDQGRDGCCTIGPTWDLSVVE